MTQFNHSMSPNVDGFLLSVFCVAGSGLAVVRSRQKTESTEKQPRQKEAPVRLLIIVAVACP